MTNPLVNNLQRLANSYSDFQRTTTNAKPVRVYLKTVTGADGSSKLVFRKLGFFRRIFTSYRKELKRNLGVISDAFEKIEEKHPLLSSFALACPRNKREELFPVWQEFALKNIAPWYVWLREVS